MVKTHILSIMLYDFIPQKSFSFMSVVKIISLFSSPTSPARPFQYPDEDSSERHEVQLFFVEARIQSAKFNEKQSFIFFLSFVEMYFVLRIDITKSIISDIFFSYLSCEISSLYKR